MTPIPATENKPYCHPYRFSLEAVADFISKDTGIPYADVFTVASGTNNEPQTLSPGAFDKLGMNHYKDNRGKLTPNEKKEGVDPKLTISEPEAARFIYNVLRFAPPEKVGDNPKFKMAGSLAKLFFGDSPLFEKRPGGTPNNVEPHEVRPITYFKKSDNFDQICGGDGCYCHDLDTCNITVYVPDECNDQGFSSYRGSTREAQIDAPERGYIPDNEQAQKFVMDMFGGHPTAAAETGMFINAKLVDNSIKAFRYLVVKTSGGLAADQLEKMNEEDLEKASNQLLMGATEDEIFLAIQTSATWIDYSGTVTMPVANGFIAFMESEAKKNIPPMLLSPLAVEGLNFGTLFAIRETTVRYTAKDTPLWMVGFKQMYDTYMRRLMTGLVAHPEFIKKYLTQQAGNDIKGFEEFFKIHAKYMARLDTRSAPLKKSKNKALREFAEVTGSDKLYKPEAIFDLQKVGETVSKFFETHKEYLADQANSWTLFKVLLGYVYPYQKYRTNDFVAYRDAGIFAKGMGVGLWNIDPVYNALWEYNRRLPRYFPKDALTGAE